MKIFFALFTFLFIQKNVFAQTENIADSSIAGIWKGKIITTDKHLPYEIAISEAGGKLTGYSYTTYTVNSVEMVAVRTLKVKNDNGNITTIDDDLLFENFDKTSPKQFKQTNTLTLKVSGNMMSLTGNFTTKKTKNFRALTGEIALTKENDLSKTAVASKLEEMKLLAAMSFVKQPEPVEEDHPLLTKKIIDVRNYLPVKIVHQLAVTAPYIKRIPILPVTVDIAKTVKKPIVEIPEKQTAVAPPAKRNVQPKPVTAKPTPVAAVAKTVVVVPKPSTASSAPSFSAALAKREIETIQTVLFKSDSLMLTLYDNGTVDGDTVSIILDGKMILSKQGLSTNPVNKTIYVPQGSGDSMQLVMYAENLGSLPPNTGLLIIKDGNDRYEIRFAGDLEKNAAIILRRRPL